MRRGRACACLPGSTSEDGALLGRFEVRATLGAGAFGRVFAAFDRERDRLVALKRPHVAAAESLYRFKQEFRALADVRHPNLVALYELFEDSGSWFFSMELVDGLPLTAALRAGLGPPDDRGTTLTTSVDAVGDTLWVSGLAPSADAAATLADPPPAPAPRPSSPPDLAPVSSAFRQLAEAVAALHAAGLLHRDLKPSNVLVTPDGRVVVLDFGLVLRERQGGPGPVVGTPLYMSPEQWLGEHVQEASDWYAVGVALYEALTGAPPFRGELFAMMTAKLRGEFAPPRALCPELPPAWSDLCAALLHPDPARRPAPAELLRFFGGDPPAVAAPRRGRVFVGRARELAALRELLARCAAGAAGIAHVSGEAGLGKTALCDEFTADLPGALVLRGRCFEQESVPYKALDAVIDGLCLALRARPARDVSPLLPGDPGLLARVFPVFEALLGPGDGAHPGNRVALRFRAAALLRELLRRLSAEAPIVVWIDDLQWGDSDSAALLHALLRPPDPPRLLAVLTYRGDDAHASPFLRELAALEREAGAIHPSLRLALGRLDDDDCRALIAALTRGDPVSSVDTQRIVRESGGIPLFVDELSRFASTWGSDDDRAHDSQERVALLARLVHERLRGLPPEAARLLAVVCLAGAPLRLEVAFAAAAVPLADRELVQLLRVRHLVRTGFTGEREALSPYVASIADLVVADLGERERCDLHLRLAEALAAAHGVAPRLVASHFHAAGQPARAAEFVLAAAERAAAALAFDEAATCFGLALDWLPRDDPRRRGLPRRHADALVDAGRGREAAPIYLHLAGLADPLDALVLRRLAAEHLVSTGDVARGEALFREIAEDADLGFPRSPGWVVAQMAYALVRLKLRGTEIRGARGPRSAARIATCFTGARLFTLVRPSYSVHFAMKGLTLALDAGDRDGVIEGLSAVGTSLALTGRAEGLRMLDQGARLAEEAGHDLGRGLVDMWSAFSLHTDWQWRHALARWDAARARLSDVPGRMAEVLRCEIMAFLPLQCLGEFKQLAARVDAAMASARATGNLYTEVCALLFHAIPRLAAGDVAGARASVRDAEARAPSDQWTGLSGLKIRHLIDLYDDRPGDSLERMLAALPGIVASRMFAVRNFRATVGNMFAGAALHALALGDPRRRELMKLARAELARFESDPMPVPQGLAAQVRAALALAGGSRGRAVDEYRAAVDHFAAGEFPLEHLCARRRLGQLLGDAALVAAAESGLRARGIADPARWTHCHAPGLHP